jgi:hypothetical protein
MERARCERRKSLVASGMRDSDEDGHQVRRSSRTKTRPLEYWRGESKQYSRVHQSLPTVKALALRAPNPLWPQSSTPRLEGGAGQKGKGSGGGGARRRAAKAAEERGRAMEALALLPDTEGGSDEEEMESDEQDEQDQRRRRAGGDAEAGVEEEGSEQGEEEEEEGSEGEE